MHLIVGLGNPGKRYAATRHNAGFMLVDMLSTAAGARCDKEGYGSLWTRTEIDGNEVVLVKPLSYMNRSGWPVRDFMGDYDVTPDKLLVLCDDCALPLGKLRVRGKGSAGGHNGLASVIEAIGTKEFMRMRLGVGAPADGEDMSDYVLEPFLKTEAPLLEEMLAEGVEAVKTVLKDGVKSAMNKFNG